MKNIHEMIDQAAEAHEAKNEHSDDYYSALCFKAGANLLKPEIERLQRVVIEINAELIKSNEEIEKLKKLESFWADTALDVKWNTLNNLKK